MSPDLEQLKITPEVKKKLYEMKQYKETYSQLLERLIASYERHEK